MSLTDTSTMQTTSNHRSLTALFDTRDAAERARRDLVAAGVPNDAIRIAGTGAAGTASAGTASADMGFWESLKDFFLPEEDRYSYAEGLRRGGFALYVRTDDATYDTAADVLDREGTVDMNERETVWRREGWKGYQPGSSYGTTGVAGAAPGLAAASTGTARAAAATDVAGDEAIPVYEEQLRVGKREVSGGRVRLRSYVVETPVNEQVSLREERVKVDRRPVDRAVAPGDAVFQDRTIEAREYVEEAVVEKSVRVTEEVSLRKTAEERSQTVSDTVRRTEVEVEDQRGAGVAAVGTTGFAGQIKAHSDVIASDGTKVGTVDHLEGTDRIKLAKNTSPDGEHHFIPLSWVDHVDAHVHLNKTASQVKAGW